MNASRRHLVVKLNTLQWPADTTLPTKRFRLLLVGDGLGDNRENMLHFAEQALARGMVYLCSWGEGCALTHDIVDEVIVRERLFDHNNTIMTTWHDEDTLQEVAEYFAWTTQPCDAYLEHSEFWLVICVRNDQAGEWLDGFLTCAAIVDNWRDSSEEHDEAE